MNSKNSKTSESHVLTLNDTDKMTYEEVKKELLYQILVFIIHGKTQKAHITTKKL